MIFNLSLVTSAPTRTQEFTHCFFGVLASDASEENGNKMAAAHAARRNFPKRRGFFLQSEADERNHVGAIEVAAKFFLHIQAQTLTHTAQNGVIVDK
ncbi:MAG TPA: hypothetical protein VKS19_10195 [Verrucomicrobiae bacterium]|nr:hypothetical protein [Verrucomicrobiae bacterium]